MGSIGRGKYYDQSKLKVSLMERPEAIHKRGFIKNVGTSPNAGQVGIFPKTMILLLRSWSRKVIPKH